MTTRAHLLTRSPKGATFGLLVALCAIALCTPARAQVVAGRDYATLSPAQHTESPGKIEVIEFFSYACPHCSEFYPLLGKWIATLPKDVVVKRVPVGFGRAAWTQLAKTYYALETTGDLARLDGAIFDAIHQQHVTLTDENNIIAWVARQGVNPVKFKTAFDSFGVNTRIAQAEQMTENYKVTGVPTLAIAGKYVVIGQSFEQMLTNADQLIVKVRSESNLRTSNPPHE